MTRVLIPALAFLFFRQPNSLSVVAGRVVDKKTGQPIAGARVTAHRCDQPGPAANGRDSVSVPTDPNGEFRVESETPVFCGVEAAAAGYLPMFGLGPDVSFKVEQGSSKADIVFRLSREVSLSGRVLDAETGRPVPHVRVEASTYRMFGAGRALVGAGSTRSDDQGRFTIAKIGGGEYYLEVSAANNVGLSKPRPIEEFRNYTAKIHARTWYPGVERLEEAIPLSLDNTSLEGIEIPVAQRKAASVRGHVVADTPGDADLTLVRVERGVARTQGTSVGLGKVKTGDEFEIDGITPCNCYLVAELSGTPSRLAAVRLDISEANQEGLILDVRPPVTLQGRVRIEGREERTGEPALPSDEVRVSLFPELGYLTRNSGIPSAPALAEDGSFSVAGLPSTGYRLRVSGMSAGYALSEVRYNGKVCPFGIVQVDGAADAQNVEVRFAPAGSILATVTDGDKPLAGATLMLAPDSAPASELYAGAALRQGKAGPDGKTLISSLLPGAYRLIAYPAGIMWADDPMFAQRLTKGRRVEVSANQQAVTEIRAESR